jgi:hypothetical protein
MKRKRKKEKVNWIFSKGKLRMIERVGSAFLKAEFFSSFKQASRAENFNSLDRKNSFC